ncbi:hypothetical protein AKJ56_00145 [candidate division MSBL1 archaeon SCGC-AAA382N08]|uniref:GlxA-like beta barrel domain-containing protein n=1 Tax=candidate division MSBL1 archaeon SCGC-AAA382N08 TaxID=1698285 RepID=A0A133VQY6_9EURY|nr:hypothetical protein AKJ56_00145 [candidate division MSBL1 archaeon SCGC-AAA382N08]
MSEKILDIVPPRKTEPEQVESSGDEPFWSLSKIVALGVVVVVAAGVFSFFRFSRAEVKIWPRSEVIKSEKSVTVTQSATSSEQRIPGRMLSVRVKDSQQFEASEVARESRAQGTIRVYNEATEHLNLIEGTRFMSASQRVYRASRRISLPSARREGGEKKPGRADVVVTAVQPGKEYNVENSKFSVPGLSGSYLYHKIYAETVEPIDGGFKGKAYQVTEQGVEQAKQSLTEQLKEKGKTELERKDYNIIPETFVQNTTGTFVSAQPGMNTDKFTVQQTVVTEAFAFKRQALNQLVEKLAKAELESGEVYRPSLNVDYEIQDVYPEQKRALIKVDFSAKVYSPVDKSELKSEIQGMSLPGLRSWLNQKEGVEKSEVTTWPSWRRSVPSDRNRIRIKVLIE